MTLPSAAVEDYEALRAAVLAGQASPAGLGAIVYHGLIEGLAVLVASAPVAARTRTPAPGPLPRDPELLRLLANMVLQTQTEVRHVY